ncbi:MAG: DUF3159 domain-containing protein [Actinomycetota bacterium]|nr:DUF3159 domain-containing protein [Actinomycetota bacterium]
MTDPSPDVRPVGHDDAVSLQAAFGGKAGLIDAGLPGVLFVLAYTFSGRDLRLALIIALASAASLSVLRLVQGQSLQYALSGFFGVGIAAFIASRTGRAEDFYLPGLFYNAGYALAFLISIVVRWPVIGVMLALITQAGMGWRKDPVLVRAYTRASWIWVGMFVIRLAVQLPLYLIGEDALVALGTARVALGVPLYLVVLLVTYRVLKSSVPAGTSVMPPKRSPTDDDQGVSAPRLP